MTEHPTTYYHVHLGAYLKAIIELEKLGVMPGQICAISVDSDGGCRVQLVAEVFSRVCPEATWTRALNGEGMYHSEQSIGGILFVACGRGVAPDPAANGTEG